MKESEALKIVDNLVTAAQKARSIIAEIGVSDEIAAELAPRSVGKGAILPILLKISERKRMSTMDYCNVMTLIDGAPEIHGAYIGQGNLEPLEIDWSLVTDGWEPE